jgi:hypothetical protein
MLRLTPRYGSARKAKFAVNSPSIASGADSVPSPYLTLLHNCNLYDTHEYFGGRCPFLSQSSQTEALVEMDLHLSLAFPGV